MSKPRSTSQSLTVREPRHLVPIFAFHEVEIEKYKYLPLQWCPRSPRFKGSGWATKIPMSNLEWEELTLRRSPILPGAIMMYLGVYVTFLFVAPQALGFAVERRSEDIIQRRNCGPVESVNILLPPKQRCSIHLRAIIETRATYTKQYHTWYID